MQHALDLARPYWPLILALIVWPIIGAALSWWLWWDTPAHWDAYAAAHPGRALAIRALRTVSPHLRKLVVAWRDYAAARSSLPPLGIALPAEKQGALVVSETRGFANAASAYELDHPQPEPFDPSARVTIVHDVAHEPIGAVTVDPRKGDGQRGSVDLPGLLTCIIAAILAGALLYGCPVVIRDPTIEPPPAPADAGTTTCHNGTPWRFTAGAWSQADRQCNRLSTDASAVVCCATPSALRPDASVHACVPMALCSPEVSR